jgi:hypothetical protein
MAHSLLRPSRLVLAAAFAVALISPAAAPALASPQTCGGTGSVTTATGTLSDGATYEIQCPAGAWNGTLFLYSHGYVAPGSANPAQDVGDPVTGAWMLSHGFALAGSSYATTGWAIQQALPDQIRTVDTFGHMYGRPDQTIAWGHSLGGIITAGLIQRYPNRFTAALPMCGVLSGGVATWNTGLDAAFAFQQLLAGGTGLQVVDITNPAANLQTAETAAAAAQATPAGRARLALSAALGDTPGWFTPLSPEPASTDYAGQEANQFLWDTEVDFPFAFELRANLEQVSGGNPSWTTGVNFARQLRESADYSEVVALYKAAGLSLRHAGQRRPEGGRLPRAQHQLRRSAEHAGADAAHHGRRPGRARERAGVRPGRALGREQPAAAADLRRARRSLRVHPGGDHRRRAGAAEPGEYRPVERSRADYRESELRGGGARPGLQHLPGVRLDLPGRLGPGQRRLRDCTRVRVVPPDALSAAVRPRWWLALQPRLTGPILISRRSVRSANASARPSRMPMSVSQVLAV